MSQKDSQLDKPTDPVEQLEDLDTPQADDLSLEDDELEMDATEEAFAGAPDDDQPEEPLPFLAQDAEQKEQLTAKPSGSDYDPPKLHKVLADAGIGYEPFGLTGGAAAGETSLRTGDATILSTRSGHHVAIELLSAPPRAEAFAMGEGKSMLAVPRGAPSKELDRLMTIDSVGDTEARSILEQRGCTGGHDWSVSCT